MLTDTEPLDGESLNISRKKGIQSVEIGCDVLAYMGSLRTPKSLTAIAAALNMSPSKAYFYVTSFVRKGIITRDDAGLYRLGPAALNLGLAALAQVDAVEEARHAMMRIRSSVDQSIQLSVWGSAGPTIVHRLPAAQWHLDLRLGAVLSPLTATGRTLMTSFPEASVERIIAETLKKSKPSDPWHKFSVAKAMGIFLEDRERGITTGFGNTHPGVLSLAAPVRDQSHNTVAAITITGSDDQFDTSYDGVFAKALLEGVRGIFS